jgi:hypothetical protein
MIRVRNLIKNTGNVSLDKLSYYKIAEWVGGRIR